MERKDIEKFLKEKKGYDENDIAEFWEEYLIVDPNFEYTERELDMFACKKGDEMDYREVDKILQEMEKSELFSDENIERIQKKLKDKYLGREDELESWQRRLLKTF